MTRSAASPAEEQAIVYVTEARVRTVSGDLTDADLLALIKKKAPDPSVFDDAPPFVWSADASNSKLDAYFTRMDERSLRNYAKDASDGVMFLDSHDKRQLGFGQSVRGVFTQSETGKMDEKVPDDKSASSVSIDFYTIPGIQLGRASSDSFIAGVRSGVIHDVSIGFMPEAFECNICRNDPFDWWSMDCMHIPGAFYDSTGKNVVTAKSQGAIQAFAWVRNARLNEVSAVYDGATPGAYIKKAHFMAEAGEVDRTIATILERQLRIKLPEQAMHASVFTMRGGRTYLARGTAIIDGVKYGEGMEIMPDAPKTFRRLSTRSTDADRDEGTDDERAVEEQAEQAVEGGEATPPKDANPNAAPEDLRMNEDQQRELAEAKASHEGLLGNVRKALDAAGIADAASIDPVEGVRQLADQIKDLTPRAQMGDRWRADVIERALGSGVRAEGKDFDAAEWTETFGSMKVEQIQRMGDTWEKIAQATLPSGGRKTSDVGTTAPREGEQGGPQNGHVDQSMYTVRR